jgi:multidrug transporter EmrE-like cation transporter
VGLFTEALNMQVQSWVVLSMPVSDYQIGGFYVIFQTLGYWLMALIPYLLYRVTGRLFEKP